ncbi:MAG: DUF2194 domain-containing protein [Tumebacillaceae bacterium]
MKRFSGELSSFPQAKRRVLPNHDHQRYLLLFTDDVKDRSATKMLEEVRMSLRYAKLPFDQLTFPEWNKFAPPLKRYVQGAVIVIGEEQAQLAHVEALKRYVEEQGGLLVNALRSSDSPFNEFMGIEGRPHYAKGVRGLRWCKRVYPGMCEQVLGSGKASSSSLRVQLAADVEVWAESTEPEETVPLLWLRRRGQGRILYWNSTITQGREWRATFIQTLLKAQGIGAKATVGAMVVYLDDFPSPTWNAPSSGNTTGLTDREFRSRCWDPDMQELANKYGLRYSAGCILSYNARVKPPFEPFQFKEEGHEGLFLEETEIAQRFGEVGLHGYNHNPLNLSYTNEQRAALGYEPWASLQAMRKSLQVTRRLWRDYLKLPMPTFYIPASNVLSKEGKKVLLEVFPELRTISSSSGVSEEYAVMTQEFLPDPDAPQIMGTPRMSYGFTTSPHRKFDLYSGIGMLGVVSHFVHPDDVFSASRSFGKCWEELREEFDEYLGEIVQRFEWLRPLTATEFAEALRHFHAVDVRIDRSESGRLTAHLSPLASPFFLEVHVDDPSAWHVVRGGEIVARNDEYGLLWVKVTETKLVLTC